MFFTASIAGDWVYNEQNAQGIGYWHIIFVFGVMDHLKLLPSSASFLRLLIKKWSQSVLRRFRVNAAPVLKVYHGFGTNGHMQLSGHALSRSPYRQEHFSSRFWRNTISLLRLFVVKPIAALPVVLIWGNQRIKTTTDDSGYFSFEWVPERPVTEGWHRVKVTAKHRGQVISGQGKLLVPPPSKYAIASDIDDTFLVSHSSDLLRRLYVLLTRNARTRKPFEAVVRHYQLLAKADKDGELRPFFYVSSSEWNLYDYIREFARCYELPDGIYLLSPLKTLTSFWKTGKGKHQMKYQRIERLLATYPKMQFILLGDDSQEDPAIYRQIIADFPGRIVCVYLRHVRSSRLQATRLHEAAIKKSGVEICYFTHSMTAIAHSQKMGLIQL